MPTLSVVIPTMNEEQYLPRLFAAIKRQTLQPDEIVVADAGSTDSTRKIAEAFGAKVVQGGLPGPGRNAGAQASTGELICFLDADVIIADENFLHHAVAEFEERRLDLASADVLLINSPSYLEIFGHKVYNFYVRLLGRFHPHMIGSFMLVRRSLHNKINGFDPSVIFCEDHDYGLRGNKVGKFSILNSVIINVTDRRFRRDGALNVGIKYIIAELHIVFLGPIRHNYFSYEFGYPRSGNKK